MDGDQEEIEAVKLGELLGPIPYVPSKWALIPGNWSIPRGLWQMANAERREKQKRKRPWRFDQAETEFGRILLFLQINSSAFGRLAGVHHAQVLRWRKGQATPDKPIQPRLIELLCRLLSAAGHPDTELEARGLFKPSAGRGRVASTRRPASHSLHAISGGLDRKLR